MPRSSAGQVVRAHLEAFSRGELRTMLATMAPDAEFRTGTTLVAPEDFEEFFGWAMRELHPTMKITNLVVDGSQVACQFIESVTVDGQRRDLDRAAFFTVDDDVITSVKVYDLCD